jgi:MYXO-CTERM domain-containing protein
MRTVLVVVVLLGGMVSRAQATTYYACDCDTGADPSCVAGDDTADGLSPATPWRTYARVRTAWGGLAAGDNIRLCAGGVFPVTGAVSWVNSACRTGQRCSLDAYTPAWASGDEGRPIIVQSAAEHVFNLADGGDAEHEEGYTFRGLEVRCAAASSWGFFLYGDVDDVILDDMVIRGCAIGVHHAGSPACTGGDACDGKNQNLQIINSTITGSFEHGYLGGGDGLLLERNVFENNGGASVFNHNVYLSQAGGPTQGVIIRDNILRGSARDAEGRCVGGSMAIHGEHTDLVIEGNIVSEVNALATCWGIAVNPAYATPESFTRLVLRGNLVIDVGNLAISVGSCTGCLIENNVVVARRLETVGIGAPGLAPSTGDAEMSALTVRNNSVYLAAGGTGVRVAEGTGHVVVSNAIQPTGGACFDLSGTLATMDHNVCGASARAWEEGSGDLAAWRTASGHDASSFDADPYFFDPQQALLRPASFSPLIDIGHPTLSSPLVFGGLDRYPPPDVGAYEFEPFYRDGGISIDDAGVPIQDAGTGADDGHGEDGGNHDGGGDAGEPGGDGDGCGCSVGGAGAGNALPCLIFLLLFARRRR